MIIQITPGSEAGPNVQLLFSWKEAQAILKALKFSSDKGLLDEVEAHEAIAIDQLRRNLSRISIGEPPKPKA